MNEYSALAQFAIRYWWWLAILTLGTAWFWRQTVRQKNGASEILKIFLMINNGVVGFLYFSGSLTSGFSRWTSSLAWSNFFSHSMAFLFFLIGLLWLLDAILGRTPLGFPRRRLVAITVFLGCTLGLIFPVYEFIGGNIFPYAQAFGDGAVPLLLFSACLLGGANPTTWLGRVLACLLFLAALDAGLISGVREHHWHYLIAFAAALFVLGSSFFRRTMVELKSNT